MTFDFLSIAIFLLIICLVGFVVKIFIDVFNLKTEGFCRQVALQEKLALEYEKSILNRQKLTLVEDLHKLLFKRLFKITRQILLLQKFKFDEQS